MNVNIRQILSCAPSPASGVCFSKDVSVLTSMPSTRVKGKLLDDKLLKDNTDETGESTGHKPVEALDSFVLVLYKCLLKLFASLQCLFPSRS